MADPASAGPIKSSKFGRKPIAKEFTKADQERFRNLLELANSSHYEGERANALAAAQRLAERHGMTLEEAASWRPSAPQPAEPHVTSADPFAYRRNVQPGSHQWWQMSLNQAAMDADKNRWESAVRAARNRGLDGSEAGNRAGTPPNAKRSNSRSRRNPISHAAVLLKETSLPFDEIADITGLDVYKIVGMKLKMRKAAA